MCICASTYISIYVYTYIYIYICIYIHILRLHQVHLSHNNITMEGADALFAAAHRYPRALHNGQVPLWLRLEHNAVDLENFASTMPPHCRAENRGDRRGGVQRTGVEKCILRALFFYNTYTHTHTHTHAHTHTHTHTDTLKHIDATHPFLCNDQFILV